MSKFKIGDKANTPDGVGFVDGIMYLKTGGSSARVDTKGGSFWYSDEHITIIDPAPQIDRAAKSTELLERQFRDAQAQTVYDAVLIHRLMAEAREKDERIAFLTEANLELQRGCPPEPLVGTADGKVGSAGVSACESTVVRLRAAQEEGEAVRDCNTCAHMLASSYRYPCNRCLELSEQRKYAMWQPREDL